MSAAEEHVCTCCGSVRRPVLAEPLTDDYELLTLACHKCKTFLNFVHEIPENQTRLVEIALKANLR